MGDAFRGLTIKIGADSRPLNSALNSIKSSAAGAQSQLRAMDKALKFNSGDVKALSSRIDLVGDKALLAARSARTIQDALRQASTETLKFSERSGLGQRNLAEMAADTRQVYAATQQLRSEYTRTNAELQQIYDGAKKAAVASDSFEKITSFEKANKFVNGLRNNLDAVGEKGKKARSILDSLVRSAAMKPETGLAQAFNMEPGLAAASKMLKVLRSLRAASAGLGNDLEMMNKVEGFRAMRTQLVAYEAELRQAAMEAARFNAQLHATSGTPGMARAIADAKSLDTALGRATAAAKKASSAYDTMPKSLEAAKAKLSAFKAEEDALNQKLRATETIMRTISGARGFDKQGALTKNVWADAEKAISEYAQLETKIRRVESALNSMYKVDAAHRNGTDVLGAAEYDKLTAKIKKAENALASMKAEMIGVDERVKSTQLAEQYREAYVEVQRLNAELAKLSQRSSALSKLGAAGQAFRQFGYGLYSTITPAIMMAGRYAIDAANDIDSAYRDMRKTVNGTEEEFEHLREAALEFSTTHVTSADTILEIEAMGGQLGIAASNLEGFSEVISSLDIATDIDSEDLAKYVGQLSNIMNDIKVHKNDPIEYQKAITSFSDSLVRLGNNSAAQESSIMKVMMRIASLGNISGFTTPQLLAISTAVAATGQGCEAAGTAISKTFSNIESAVGAGGDKLQGFADVAGMSAQEFAAAWEGDPVTAFTAFIEGLKRIDTEGGSVDNTLKSLGINSVRQKQALEGLTNTLDVLHDSLGMSQDAWNGMSTVMSDGSIEKAGDAAREAQRKSEGFSGQLQMMKNAAQLLSNELAQGATPIITALGDLFRDLALAVKGMPQEMKTFAVAAAGFLAVLGPLSVGLGTLLSAFGNIKGVASGVQGAFVGMAAKIDTLSPKTLTATRGLIGLQKALNFLSTGKGMLAVAGASIAVAHIASEIQNAVKQYEIHNKAIEGMAAITASATPNANKLASGVAEAGEAAKRASVDYNALMEKQAQLVDTINERNSKGQAEISMLQQARNSIASLMNKTDEHGRAVRLSSQEQAELYRAIQLVNEACGTQYSVVDAVNGKIANEKGVLQDTIAEIDVYIAKKQQAIRQDVLNQNYADTYSQYLDDVKAESAAWDEVREKARAANEQGDAASEAAYEDALNKYETMKQARGATEEELNLITAQMGANAKIAKGVQETFADLAKASPELSAAFEGAFGTDYAAKLQDFTNQLEGVGVSVDEFSKLSMDDMFQLAAAYKENGGDVVAALESVGVKVQSLGELFTEKLTKAGMDFNAMAQQVGVSTDELAAKLNQAGVSTQDLARIGTENFALLAEACGNDSAKVVAAISAINALGLDPKEMSVHDNIVEIQGHVIDLNNMTIDGKEFKITETGAADVKQSAQEVSAATDEADGEVVTEFSEEGGEEVIEVANEVSRVAAETGHAEPSITFSSNADEVLGEMNEVEGYSFDTKTVEVDAETESAQSELDDLNSYDFAPKSISVYVTGGALWELYSISAAVWSIPSYREIEVRTVHTDDGGGYASGGIYAGAIRAIPRHADGGLTGIVTRATLTNIGWVGEAGDEALLNMKHAGGAIIPLSNRQHVRPFAQAVAAEMTGFGQSQKAGDTYNITVNASGNGDDIARSVTKAIRAQNLMKGRR